VTARLAFDPNEASPPHLPSEQQHQMMAANQGNTPLHLQTISAQQGHLAALQAALQTAKLQAKMTADDRRRAFREATADLCEVTISSACVGDPIIAALKEFHLFPKLPIELRIKICKFFLFFWRYFVHSKLHQSPQ
jgi:hypothetical protein